MVDLFRWRRPSLEGDPDFPSQPIRIDQVRVGRLHRESGLSLRATMTGVFWTSPGGLTQQSKRVIRITFRIIPSEDGRTSSEARMAWDWFPPRPHPILPAAIPSRRYSDIRNNDVSFPLPSGDISPTWNPNLFRSFSSPSDGSIRLVRTTFGSTEYGLTGRSVPFPGLVRPRAVRPLQKLGRHESESLLDFTQSSQRLSHLDVTQPSGTMRFPSNYTQKGSVR
jgi:hypothetical protein